jgi:hypothetical protein
MTLLPRAGRRASLALVLLLAGGNAPAGTLVLPPGMGGVPDIGAIPCSVLTKMMVVGPLGTRHSLLTWTAGYLKALSGRSLQELVDAAGTAGRPWTYEQLGDDLVAYCAANPKAVTAEAASSLAGKLGVGR